MTVELIDDADASYDAVGTLLTARIEHNLIATVLDAVREGRYDESTPRFAVVRGGDGTVLAAALRTPPYPMTCTVLSARDADELVGA